MKQDIQRTPPTKRRVNRVLSDKQKLFIAEFLIDGNATRAAKTVGYSPKTAASIGYNLLQDKLIKGEISRLQAKHLATAGITAQAVLNDLRDIIEEVKGEKTPAFYQVRLRSNELLGKYHGLWDNGNSQDRQRRPHELSDKELIALGMELQKGKAEPKTIEATIINNGGSIGGTSVDDKDNDQSDQQVKL